MVFPLVKLSFMVAKRISSYAANFLKLRAKKSTFFKNRICMPTAQLYHSFEVKIRLRLLGLGKANYIEKLTDTVAVDLGAELLGEIIIYTTGTLLIYAEYYRSSLKEEAYEQAKIQKDLDLEQRLQEQGLMIVKLHSEVREMRRIINDSKNTSLTTKLVGKS